MHIGPDNYEMVPTNFLLSTGSGAVAFVMANWEPMLTFGLPVAFFVVGKIVDVALRIHLHKKEKR